MRSGQEWGFRRRLNLESDEPHELDPVAFRDDTIVKLEVECHSAILNLVLKMDVSETAVLFLADVGQGQVVGADEADGAACQESAYDPFGADEAVLRVCALEELVQEKEDGGCFSARSQMWRRRVISA